MKIGLLSDTHGFIDDGVYHHFRDCDEIWHAGDIGTMATARQLASFKTFRAVYGNIDGSDIRANFGEHLRFRLEGLDIWMTHIAGYPPRYNKAIRSGLLTTPPDVFICGHSHILKIMTDSSFKNMLFINPGAAGRRGFHLVKTLVRFEIEDGAVSKMQVIKLGRREA